MNIFESCLAAIVICALVAALIVRRDIALLRERALAGISLALAGYVVGAAVASKSTTVDALANLNAERFPESLPAYAQQPTLETLPAPAKTQNAQVVVDVIRLLGTTSQSSVAPLKARNSDVVIVSGWAFDTAAGVPCSRVALIIDNSQAFHLQGGISRPDVATFLKKSKAVMSGFSGYLPTPLIGTGQHELKVACINAAGQSASNALPLPVTIEDSR